MANHQSAQKRIRQAEARNIENRYHGRTTRNTIRKIRTSSSKEEASGLLTSVYQMLDKEAKRNNIHKNKAANIKSSLAKHVNSL